MRNKHIHAVVLICVFRIFFGLFCFCKATTQDMFSSELNTFGKYFLPFVKELPVCQLPCYDLRQLLSYNLRFLRFQTVNKISLPESIHEVRNSFLFRVKKTLFFWFIQHPELLCGKAERKTSALFVQGMD